MARSSTLRHTTQVVILDRRGFDRLALELLCLEDPELAVVASVDGVAGAVAAVSACEGAVVLAGRRVVREAGAGAVARLRRAGAGRVILVGTGDLERLQLEAMRVDADAILQRDGESVAQLAALHGEGGTVPRWSGHDGTRPGRMAG